MVEPTRYKADYLKVTRKDGVHTVRDIQYIIRACSEIAHRANSSEEIDPQVFGFFYEVLRTGEWVVLRFDPYSVDCNIGKKDTAYQTRGSALNAAVKYLNDNGYQAKSFDLEGMIDAI